MYFETVQINFIIFKDLFAKGTTIKVDVHTSWRSLSVSFIYPSHQGVALKGKNFCSLPKCLILSSKNRPIYGRFLFAEKQQRSQSLSAFVNW